MLQSSDEVLVDRCRSGDRDAFAEIVRRYQTLICSVAYAATGNLAVSEEIAQETFISAWRSIANLREPAQLRHWLCGIVRNLSNSGHRAGARDVLTHAGDVDRNDLVDRRATDPAEHSIVREEIELVDRTLSELPPQYREPLVLFYRENQSVARVAEQLGVSNDVVKQRLARGRKMLREGVESIIERGLIQSAPGRAFTVGVMSALPIMTGSAKAATLAVTSAKGIGTMNVANLAAWAGAILGPIAGIAGAYFGYSMSLKSARSDRERSFIRKMTLTVFCLAVALMAAIGALVVFGSRIAQQGPGLLAIAIIAVAAFYVFSLTLLIVWGNRGIARIRREDGTTSSLPDQMPAVGKALNQTRLYESKFRLLGLPLVAVKFGGSIGLGDERGRPAIGWIAVGDRAYGVLFASGSLAVGGIAVGAIAVGPVAVGGLGIGLLAMAGFSMAVWSLGGAAIGWYALGGVAVAVKAAFGGLAVAKSYALGGVAYAEHVNDAATRVYVDESVFLQWSQSIFLPWGGIIICLIAILPTVIAIRMVPPVDVVESDG